MYGHLSFATGSLARRWLPRRLLLLPTLPPTNMVTGARRYLEDEFLFEGTGPLSVAMIEGRVRLRNPWATASARGHDLKAQVDH